MIKRLSSRRKQKSLVPVADRNNDQDLNVLKWLQQQQEEDPQQQQSSSMIICHPPKDVISIILAFCGPQMIFVLNQTNRFWRDFIQDDETWRVLCEELYKWKPGDPVPKSSWKEYYRVHPCVPIDYPSIRRAIKGTLATTTLSRMNKADSSNSDDSCSQSLGDCCSNNNGQLPSLQQNENIHVLLRPANYIIRKSIVIDIPEYKSISIRSMELPSSLFSPNDLIIDEERTTTSLNSHTSTLSTLPNGEINRSKSNLTSSIRRALLSPLNYSRRRMISAQEDRSSDEEGLEGEAEVEEGEVGQVQGRGGEQEEQVAEEGEEGGEEGEENELQGGWEEEGEVEQGEQDEEEQEGYGEGQQQQQQPQQQQFWRNQQRKACLWLVTEKINEPIFLVRRGNFFLKQLDLNHNSNGMDLWNGNAAVHVQPPLSDSDLDSSSNGDYDDYFYYISDQRGRFRGGRRRRRRRQRMRQRLRQRQQRVTWRRATNFNGISNATPLPPNAVLEHVRITSQSGRGIVNMDGGNIVVNHCSISGCAATGIYLGNNASNSNGHEDEEIGDSNNFRRRPTAEIKNTEIIHNGIGSYTRNGGVLRNYINNNMNNNNYFHSISPGHAGLYLEQGQVLVEKCSISQNTLSGICMLSPTKCKLWLEDSLLTRNGVLGGVLHHHMLTTNHNDNNNNVLGFAFQRQIHIPQTQIGTAMTQNNCFFINNQIG